MVSTRVGADLVATAVYPVALMLHRVAGESLVEALDGLDRTTGVDVAKVWAASDVVDEHIGDEPVATVAPRIAVRAAEYDLPAGLVAAIDLHLKARSAGDRLLDTLTEVGNIRAEAGWPPLAAPIGQILGSQAILNILSARRYGSLLDEFRLLVEGRYGTTPAPVEPSLQRIVELLAQEAVVLDDDPPSAEDVRVAADGLAASEEELVLLAMFGQEAETLLQAIRHRHSREASLLGGDVDVERAERIRELVKIVQESGVGEIEIEDEGMRVSVRRADDTVQHVVVARPGATESEQAQPSPVRVDVDQGRVTDGRCLLPAGGAGNASVRRGRRCRDGRPDALPARGDEALQRAPGRERRTCPLRSTSRTDSPSSSGRCCSSSSRSRSHRPSRRMFSRVLVANRGEIAVRVIRALHELDIEAVAVYSTADEDALHVKLADHAVCLGPPAASESYLRIPSVVAAAEITKCEAVHPGYGFLAENSAFARACADNDLVFVGPSPEVMDRLGDKAQAKVEMRAAGVPLVPGSAEAGSLTELRDAADEIGFPGAAQGDGRRRWQGDATRHRARGASTPPIAPPRPRPRRRSATAALYVEKAVSPARHVEIQVICDTLGGVLTLGERECSVQRRHQKLIEESPSPALTPETREAMEAAVERACRSVGYVNAGTFEFILGEEGNPYFIEVNCRLQVEHPVTELVTGIDLVREQLRVAAGEALSHVGRAPRRGHAIEIRLNAEDPAHGFRPAPGLIERFRVPLGPGVRIDTAISDGVSVPPYYDSMIAKLIVHDDDRRAAIARAIRCLEELEVVGIPTTRDLALDVLRSEGFASGDYSTGYLEEMASTFPSLRPATA